MGTPQFAVPILQALLKEHEVCAVITQPDRPRGRGKMLKAPPVKEAAQGLTVLQPESIKAPELVATLQNLAPEIIVVAAYGQILPAAILTLPPHGCINVHASLLPRYRGAAPIHRAVINGETITGVTTMLMNEGLDTGHILLAAEVPIKPETTTGELYSVLAQRGARLLLETLDRLQNGQLTPLPQKEELATYAPPLTPQEELVDWNRPAVEVLNQIRGLDPIPGAYTFFPKGRLKLFGARLAGETSAADPGRVIEIIPKEGFVVACQKGSVLITRVQPQGKPVMEAGAFLRGYPLKTTDYFG